MKNFRNYLLLICFIAALVGCDDEKNDPKDTPVEISPSPGSDQFFTEGINLTSGQKSQTVSFTTNKDWEITLAATRSGTSWCKVEPMSGGPGEVNLTITAEENTGYDDRSIALTIVSGDIKKTISVAQKQKNALTITNSRFQAKPEGETIAIEVNSKVN